MRFSRLSFTGLDSARGYALLDALVALALLGLAAAGVASLVHLASGTALEARRLDAAREAASSVLDRLERVAWIALPARFGAAPSDTTATLDSGDGSLAGAEGQVVREFPGGRMQVTVDGLGVGGVSVPFEDALALRLRAEASWTTGGVGTRRVVLESWRF